MKSTLLLLAPLFCAFLVLCAGDDSLDSFIKSRMKKVNLPSLSLAIIKDGHIEDVRTYGFADPAKGTPISSSDLYMIASISKTVTATSVMQLYDAGLIGLDDDINKYLKFKVSNPRFPSSPITIRMLLTHTSSISDEGYPDKVIVEGDSPIALGDFMKAYLVEGGEYYKTKNYSRDAPGTAYDYSNIGAALLGHLVEAVKGVDFAVDSTDNVLRPLNMTTSAWHLKDVPNGATVVTPSYWVKKKKVYRSYEQYGYPDYPNGQLRAPVAEIANHLLMVMNGGSFGGKQIIKEETVAEMLRIQDGPAKKEEQGLIWYYKELKGRTLVGHNGGDDGVATEAFYEPASKVGFVILTNGEWDEKDKAEKAIDKIEARILSLYAPDASDSASDSSSASDSDKKKKEARSISQKRRVFRRPSKQ